MIFERAAGWVGAVGIPRWHGGAGGPRLGLMEENSQISSQDALRTRVSLLEKARTGNNHPAWEELLTYYDPFVSKVLGAMGFRGADLEDARQQVAVKLWNGLRKYERDPDRAKFRTWFAKLIRNVALNIVRAGQRQPTGPSLDDEKSGAVYLMADSPEIEARVEEEWQQYVVQLAMERVRGRFSGNAMEVFSRSLAGEEVEDIARELGIKINTVYILKHRVKTMLLKEIQLLKHDLEGGRTRDDF